MVARPIAKKQSTDAAAPEKQRLRAVAGYFADPEAGDAGRLIYEHVRLGIMSALSVNSSMRASYPSVRWPSYPHSTIFFSKSSYIR